MLDILANAHSSKDVLQRYLSAALKLQSQGVTYPHGDPRGRKELSDLIRAHVPGLSDWDPEPETGLCEARSAQGNLLGGIAISAMSQRSSGVHGFIRAVVVHPEHRVSGVATVLLGMTDQIIHASTGKSPTSVIGSCPPDLAQFYAKCGYTVLNPGATLPSTILGSDAGTMVNTSTVTPCYFVGETAVGS